MQPVVPQSEGAATSPGEGSLDKLVNELSTAIGLRAHEASNPLPSNTFQMGQQ
jgi:hypothetical protein